MPKDRLSLPQPTKTSAAKQDKKWREEMPFDQVIQEVEPSPAIKKQALKQPMPIKQSVAKQMGSSL